MEKHYTKYNFKKDKVELCEGLTAEKLKSLGFTNYNPKKWYFCRTISEATYKGGDRFSETLNIRIDSKTFTKLETDILDEAFLQPALNYVEYYLGEKPFESLSKYCQEGVKRCDDYIKYLVDNNVIRFKNGDCNNG